MIYLAQTDTTAGFLSKSQEKLNLLKNRAYNKPCVILSASFKELQTLARPPKKFKNFIRKAKKTSFVYKNQKAIRILQTPKELVCFLAKNGYFYSSSANKHQQNFNQAWAKSVSDLILGEEFFEASASRIFKLNNKKLSRLR